MNHGPHHHHSTADEDDAALIELLDLDAEVLSSYLSDVTARVHQLAGDLPSGRILDLGCGTGNAAVVLAQRFAGADVIAVDRSADSLARLQAKARDLGLADRIRTVQADLDESWPVTDPVDVVWMSMALHHLADPDDALAKIHATTRPGGLLAVAEITDPLRFLPDDIGLGRPGLQARFLAAMTERYGTELPHLGADWGLYLTRAGFTDMTERPFPINLTAPLPPSAGRYAQEYLRRTRAQLDGAISADDLSTLGILLDGDGPDSVLHRQDLAIRTTRTLWTARRP